MKRADAEILTVADLAELFACDKETAAARLTSGDLPGVKVGRGWIIPREALFERLNEKARQESAYRRTQHAPNFEECQQHRKTAKNKTSVQLAESPLVPTSSPNNPARRGRQRREPPTLPPLLK